MMTSDSYFDSYASLYDQLQPVLIENYRTYHSLALDFVPGDSGSGLRILDLGCGTGTFLNSVFMARPGSTALALDYSQEMLDRAAEKPSLRQPDVEFVQRDLNDGLPTDIGKFDLVLAFSAIHHLGTAAKKSLIQQVFDSLVPGGWFFLVDAMVDQFDDDVFAMGRGRELRLRADRIDASSHPSEVFDKFDEIKGRLAEGSPERDRIASVQNHVCWMEGAGFTSIDHIWHHWFEHFFIARR